MMRGSFPTFFVLSLSLCLLVLMCLFSLSTYHSISLAFCLFIPWLLFMKRIVNFHYISPDSLTLRLVSKGSSLSNLLVLPVSLRLSQNSLEGLLQTNCLQLDEHVCTRTRWSFEPVFDLTQPQVYSPLISPFRRLCFCICTCCPCRQGSKHDGDLWIE